MSDRAERALLTAILGLFLALAIAYGLVVPVFEAHDELFHYPLVRHIAQTWSLPVQDPATVGPWEQEGGQPPLYYVLAAAATFWIDTSDMETVRQMNPYVAAGVATPDGSNLDWVIHNPSAERFPWRGTALAVHLLRLLGAGLGAVTVYLTYRLARALFPGHPEWALGAAAINGFTPMFIFITVSVSNDSLVVPLCSLALVLIANRLSPITNRKSQAAEGRAIHDTQHATRTDRRSRVDTLLLGLVVGLAALTKESALALVPLALLAVAVAGWRRRVGSPLLQRLGGIAIEGLLVLLPVLLVAGWWYVRNWHLYGDPLGLNVFLEIVGRRAIPADLAQLWRERTSFLAGYWGNFGSLNVPMSPWVYAALAGIAVLAAVGCLLAIWKLAVGRWRLDIGHWSLFIGHCSLVIVLLWPLLIVISWARWSSVTPASQGRLVFPAISVWSLLLALGLAGWLPRRWGGWAIAAFVLFLLGLSAAAPWAWIAPAYAQPAPLNDAEVAAIPDRLEADFDGTMRLLGYDLETEAVEPGGIAWVTLYWQALAPTDRELAVFVHLLGEGEMVVAQRDSFPGLGRLSTTRLEPGFRWAERVALELPATAYAPDVTQVEVGLYDPAGGARLAAASDGAPLGDALRFGRVEVRALPGDVPNPVAVDFDGQMMLTGYDLSGRVVAPGETVTLTLVWQGQHPMATDYTVSAQLVDAGQRKAAQHDGWPQGGAAPTTTWEPARPVTDTHALTVYPDAPPGVYDLRLVVYVLESGNIVQLPVIASEGQMPSDYVVLTRVRVR